MPQKKAVNNMSAAELYALAEARELEEVEAQKAEVRAKIDRLREERRAMVAKHKKALAVLDAKIRKLGGRAGGTRRKRGSGPSTTDAVLAIVQKAKKISTKDIKTELEKSGIIANNLSQTLAYLKRQGKLKSPERSIYSVK